MPQNRISLRSRKFDGEKGAKTSASEYRAPAISNDQQTFPERIGRRSGAGFNRSKRQYSPKHIALPMLAVLTLFSVPGHAIDPSIAPQKMVVCVEKTSEPSLVLVRAKMIANQIFSHIGIRVEWRGPGRFCPAIAGQAVPLEIRVLTKTRQDYFPVRLDSQLFDRIHGEVFYDRVGSTVEPSMAPYLLAYTLVHEITHLLQGTDGHSDATISGLSWFARRSRLV